MIGAATATAVGCKILGYMIGPSPHPGLQQEADMKWILVIILLNGNVPTAKFGGVFNNMMDCFSARSVLVTSDNAPDQAICVQGGDR